MNGCEGYREVLLDRRYGLTPADDPQVTAALDHLGRCPECSLEEENLSLLLGALNPAEAFPRESDVDWNAFSRRTVARAVESERTARTMRVLPGGATAAPRRSGLGRSWAAAAALVVTSGLGILAWQAGRIPAGGPQRAADHTAAPRAGVLVSQSNIDHLTVNLARNNTARYLTETRAVLVTLLDVGIDCDDDKVDVSAEKAKALELLRRQRLVANELNRLPLQRAQDVCDDLEHLLLEIASLGDCTRNDEIQSLRDVVDQRQILVRMELLSQELARKGAASV